MTKQNTYRLRTVICTLGVALSLVALFTLGFGHRFTPTATAAPSSYLNFQARLKNSSGAVVPDGYYNIEFKIYDVSTGGTALWTETRTGANKVRVANGYLTVSLGSVTAFPSTIQWGEEHWITMNIGGTGSASWDGEMNPRLQLTAVPHAFSASQAGKLSTTDSGFTNQLVLSTPTANHTITAPNASGTILLDSTVTTAISDAAFLQGGNSFSGTATLGTTDNNGIDFITNNTTVFQLSNTGAATFKNTSTIALQVQNAGGDSLLIADTSNMKLTVEGDIVAAGSATATTATTSGTGTNTTSLVLTGAAFADNDVIFIDNAGQDYFTRIVSGGGTNTPTVSPAISYDNAATVTKYNVQNIGATSSDYTSQNNKFFQGYFLGGIVTGTGSTIYADGTIKSGNDLKIDAGTIFLNADVQFKNGINSATAFQLQNSDDIAIFTGNTDGLSVQIGSSTTDDNAVLLVADSYEDGASGDPTGVNGAIYYNTDLNKFRCYQDGAWVDCVSAGAGGANTSLSNLSSVALNTSLLPGSSSIDLGSSASPFRDLYLGGTATNNFKITGTATGARTLTLPDETGTFCTTAGSAECLAIYSSGGGGGITSVGTIDTQTKSADGAVISGSAIYLQTADATHTGLVTASTQTFGGAKTFNGTLTVTGAATFNGGLSVTAGQQLTNAGSLLLTAISIGNKATGGDIGSAAATVDVATSFNVNQTTVGQILTLPTPTSATAGRVAYVSNVGSASFTMYGVVVSANNTSVFYWNGTVWSSAGIDGSGANYIQNQSSSDQTGDFRISGTGRANTSLQSPSFDRYDSGTLTIGGTNATAISLNENTTVTGTLAVTGQTTLSDTLNSRSIIPVTDDTYDLGSSTNRFRDLYLGPNSLHIGADGDEGVISYDTTHDTFNLDKSVKLSVDSYINFGTISGVGGYGIRDNNGILEVKDAGGSWVQLTTLGSGGGGGGSGGSGGSNAPFPTVESYTANTSGDTSTRVGTVPAGTQSGDLLVVIVYANGGCDQWMEGVTSMPTGFTMISDIELNGGCFGPTNAMRIFSKIADSEIAGNSLSFSFAQATTGGVVTLRISGANSVLPVDTLTARTNAMDSTFGSPAFTTSQANTLGLLVGLTSGVPHNTEALSGWSQFVNTGAGYATVAKRNLADADTYAAINTSLTDATTEYHQMVALAVAPATSNGIYPGVATLQDNFDDNSIDSGKWTTLTNSGGSVSESTQQIKMNVPTTNGAYAMLMSQNAYSANGKFAAIEFVGTTHPTYTNEGNMLLCDSADPQLDTCVAMGVYNNNVYGGYYDNGGWTGVWETSYNSTTHKYWRIREAGGVTYWETSSDNTSWTTRSARNNPIDMTSVRVQIMAGNLSGAVATTSTFTYDNFYFGTADSSVSYNPANYVVLQGGNTMGTTLSVGTLDAYNFNLLAGGATVVELDGTDGSATFHNSTNSASAFQIQNSLAGIMFNVDTANSRVYIGDPTPDTTGVTLVLDTKTNAGDPTGVNGAMYYSEDTDTFRCYENGAWKDCINAIGNTLTLGDASNAGTVELSDGSSNTVGLTASGVGANYTLKLPTGAGSTGQCLRTDSVDANQLVFGSCAAAGGDGGVLSLGALDGQTANSNGGAIQGTLFYQQSATGTNPGLVNTGTQTFAGNKTFSGTLDVTGAVSLASSLNVTGGATFGSTVTLAGAGLVFSGVTTDITTAGNQDLTLAPNGTGNIVLGVSDTTGTQLVLDTKTGSGDPTGVNGGMYYNSNAGKFRCYENGAWKDCLSPWIQVKKTADQDVTNSSTYTDDTALQFSVDGTSTYAVNFYICYAGTSASADYKGQFTFPATSGIFKATGRYNATNASNAASASAGVVGTSTTVWGNIPMGTEAGTTSKRIFEGFLSVQPGSAGTFKYQFAQNTQTAAHSARTCANSFLEYQAL